MASTIGLSTTHNNPDEQIFYLLLIIFYFILFYFILITVFFAMFNNDCQPQIPAEEATVEGRNVRPGLCPKIFMHQTILRIFYSLTLYLYILLYSTLQCMTNCVANCMTNCMTNCAFGYFCISKITTIKQILTERLEVCSFVNLGALHSPRNI